MWFRPADADARQAVVGQALTDCAQPVRNPTRSRDHCLAGGPGSTAPPPGEAYPYDEGRARNVVLNEPGWDGYLILDVVDGQIAYVEVLDRPPLD